MDDGLDRRPSPAAVLDAACRTSRPLELDLGFALVEWPAGTSRYWVARDRVIFGPTERLPMDGAPSARDFVSICMAHKYGLPDYWPTAATAFVLRGASATNWTRAAGALAGFAPSLSIGN